MAGKKSVLILIVLSVLAGQVICSQEKPIDYSLIFGNDWTKALAFLDENNTWIKSALEKFDIPYEEAVAVVFPELVRYSALRDKMEITMLKTLYRNLGDDYANFSIGVFQIKPSFAEEIHRRVSAGSDRELKLLFSKRSSFQYPRLYRAYVISDLEDPETELNYIIAFYRICTKHFADVWTDKESRIRYFATAYNTGQIRNAREIEMMTGKKFFNTKLFKTENYSYSDVSLYWYNHFSIGYK